MYLVIRLAEADPAAVSGALLRERTLVLTTTSLALSITVSIVCLALGVPAGWALARIRLPMAGLWPVLAALPLAIPSYLMAFAWVSTWPGLSGFWPLAAIMILACTPYVTLPVAAAFRLADRRPADAARTLGRSPLGAFRAATLPQIAPAALAGALLAALYTLSDFGSPSLLRVQTLTWAVYSAFEGGLNRTLAAATALVLVALSLTLVLIERTVRGHARRGGHPAAAIAPAPRIAEPVTRSVTMSGLMVLAAVSLGIPAIALLRRGLESRPTELDWARLLESTWTTLTLSLGGALLAVAIGLPVATLAARYWSRLIAVLESVVYLGNGIPGLVVGLSLVFFTLNVLPDLYQSALALCLAYAVIFLPKAVGSARSAIEQVPASLEDISHNLGRSTATTWATVTARLSAPGIATGGFLVAVTAMKELPATLMLLPIGANTLATELWRHTTMTAYAAAAPMRSPSSWWPASPRTSSPDRSTMQLDVDDLIAWHPTRSADLRVLDQVTFTVPAGAMAAVLGPSGSGKSTLLRAISGLHRHATGSIRLGQRSLDGLPPQRRRVGLVPQDGALFPHLTTAENIAFGLPRLRRHTARVGEILDLLDLTPYAHRLPHQLSGGQAQRVAVARALAPAPDVLLLDEPFSALDAGLRTAVRDRVRSALTETGTTAVLVTHDQAEALSMASRLIVLADGRVRQMGTPESVYTAPADLWTGIFLGEANVLEAKTDGRRTATHLGILGHPVTGPGEVTILIRPEQIELAATPAASNATVGSIQYFGHDALLSVMLDSGHMVRARVPAPVVHGKGDRVAATVTTEVRAYPRRLSGPHASAVGPHS
ncbi:ATP-binding cassette domain-containing protein [Microbacterium sp.]|uniref:ATP-binding cassette domain-containing protein n=1 Tax=Microbacterium sp. TaxID=51671 RepID=UPI003C72B86F